MVGRIFALLTVAVIAINCAPAEDKKPVEVVRYEYEHLPDNAYRYVYETSDGQYKDEYGHFEQVGEEKILFITGQYSYIGDDGKTYKVRYKSDNKGYRASGDHLPNTNTDVEPETPAHFPPHVIATLAG